MREATLALVPATCECPPVVAVAQPSRGAELLADAAALALIAGIAGGAVALNGGARAGLVTGAVLAAGLVVLMAAGRRMLAEARERESLGRREGGDAR